MNVSTVFLSVLLLLLLSAVIVIAFLFLRYRKKDKLYSLSLVEQERLKKVNLSILEITQAVVGTENPEDLYNLILQKVIDSIPNANVGSVLIKNKEGLYSCIAQQGFDKDKIKDFQIPLEGTIIWKYTGGNIRKTEIINDVTTIAGLEIKPLTVDPEEWSIRSSIAVPLFQESEIVGLLHIDSKEINAFSEEDLTTMEHIRSSIEVALQKFQLYRNMVMLSRYDSLTGAFNRSHFTEQFKALLNKSERYGEDFSLIIFDIDKLKMINDTHGHITGDHLLKTFSITMLNQIRRTDIFARWGGDEFIAIFYEINEKEIAEKINSIRQSLTDNPLSTPKGDLSISFSSGHAIYPTEGKDFESLLKTADNRMYVNKKKKSKE
jgi:diguanylate cyclase (GGDEF)-like protein